MYVYVIMYVCMYACIYVCMYTCMFVCMYIHMYVCMYVCINACMYVCSTRYNIYTCVFPVSPYVAKRKKGCDGDMIISNISLVKSISENASFIHSDWIKE